MRNCAASITVVVEVNLLIIQMWCVFAVQHHPRVPIKLNNPGGGGKLQSFCMQVFNQSLIAMDDVFIVRYAHESQTALELHTDAGDISFMVALSHPGIDYDSGGTFFEELDDVVMLQKGEMILFNAKLFHSGVPITSGRRYLLVGFCYTSPEAANEPGNVALDFTLIGSQQQ